MANTDSAAPIGCGASESPKVIACIRDGALLMAFSEAVMHLRQVAAPALTAQLIPASEKTNRLNLRDVVGFVTDDFCRSKAVPSLTRSVTWFRRQDPAIRIFALLGPEPQQPFGRKKLLRREGIQEVATEDAYGAPFRIALALAPALDQAFPSEFLAAIPHLGPRSRWCLGAHLSEAWRSRNLTGLAASNAALCEELRGIARPETVMQFAEFWLVLRRAEAEGESIFTSCRAFNLEPSAFRVRLERQLGRISATLTSNASHRVLSTLSRLLGETKLSVVGRIDSVTADGCCFDCDDDRLAFGRLFTRHYRHVILGARRRGLSAEDAEDAAQQFFLRLAERGAIVWSRESLGPGWFVNSGWKAADHIIRREVQRSKLHGSGYRPWSLQGDSGQLAVTHEIRLAVDQLPEPQRACALLFHLGGWSQEDIGAILDLTTNAVKAHVKRAKPLLREALRHLP